jgi:hypothetical protein
MLDEYAGPPECRISIWKHAYSLAGTEAGIAMCCSVLVLQLTGEEYC